MMKTSKQPISHALTSLNGISADFAEPSSTKPGAKVRHLPNAIGKKKEGDLRSPLDIVIERSRDFFFREQLPQGYWWAELESNVTIAAEYIMLFHFLGMVNKERERKMANYLLEQADQRGLSGPSTTAVPAISPPPSRPISPSSWPATRPIIRPWPRRATSS